MGSPRILILSVKAGAGHLRAAAALAEAFGEAHPDLEVRNLDALDFTNKAFRKSFTGGYETLARELPSVWGLLYETMEDTTPENTAKKFAALFDRLNARPLRKEVKRFAPEAVICTHFLPAEVLAPRRRKGKLACPLFVALTDYDIHSMWIQEGVDRYFVASEEMAYALRHKGIGAAEVSVSGIPISPVFARSAPDRATVRRRLGLRPDAPTILMSAGGFGLGKIDALVDTLAADQRDLQILAIAGRSEDLRSRLERVARAHPGAVIPFGFVDNIHELMAASDLAVAKSGGLTASECLAQGLPLVIIRPIPGQEERNADYLLERGAAVRANSAAHILYKTQALLRDPQRLERMRQAALAAARPRAAFTIADAVVAAVCSEGVRA